MGTNDLCLRPLPYLDAKWLRVDLYGALRDTECTAVQFNNLVKDNELIISDGTQQHAVLNSAGNVSYVNSFGKHYCGVADISCLCSNGPNCTGICRPNTECNCDPCHQLDEETTKKSSNCGQNRAQYEPSDTILDSWLWGPMPSVEQKANCIKSLLTEQRELSLQAASHSLSAIHLKQCMNIYHRYFIALARFKSTKNDDCYSDTIEGQVDTSYQKCGSIDSLVMKDAEKAALARVGARAALNFSFAFLRRAWRSGEDTDLCSELLTDALAALQGLPEASLFDSSQVSALWIEVLERSTKFLRQVVLGDVMGGRCLVPRSDRHIALSLLLELSSQKGTLSASLEAILLLLTLWDKEKDVDDNRTPNQTNGAPLVPILRRYGHISSQAHTKEMEGTTAASPTESFLRFLTLPDSESANVDLRQAAVVIISHLDRLAKPQLPTGSYAPKTKRTKHLQQLLTLGSFSVSSENYGFTSEHVTEFPMLGYAGSKYSTTFIDLGPNASIKQVIFSANHVYMLTTVGEVFMLDNEITSEPKVEPVDIPGCAPVIQIAGYCEGKYLFALNEKRELFVLSDANDGRRSDVTALKIQAFSDKFVKTIHCGATYCAVVTVSGGLYTFGRGLNGCAAVLSEEKFAPNVVQSMFGHMVIDVAISNGGMDSNSLCVTSDGNVYAWNDVDLGKAGNSSYSGGGGSQFPIQIEGLSRICRVFSCSEFNVALSFDGSVYVWNDKIDGKSCPTADTMSDEKSKDYWPYPRRIQPLEGKNIVDAAVGCAHCLLITSTGEVYGFGRNDYNQICPKTISTATTITTPIQVTPSSLRTTGISCGPAQSILWSNTSSSGVLPQKIPFVVDLTESTFRLIEQLLAMVCGQTAIASDIRHPPNQESECIAVASLNLLRLQLHALITNNINPQTVGLGEGSRLLTSLKTRILSLAGGPTILKTMQDAAQWTLQIGWSVFLPTAAERAQTLTSLLPSDPSASSTSGHRFMTDLLVGSLMAEEGLQTALKQAINSEPEVSSTSGHNLPLLHLIKQLLRNNAALTQARLGQLSVGPYIKSEDDYVQPGNPSPSLDLLHRFQRLLLSHLHQSKNEDLAGAEALLAKYMQQIITLSVATLTKASEIILQGKDGIVPVLATDISDTLLYELIIGLILLHRDFTTTILPSFEWTKLFVPLLNCLDCLNRIIGDADIQDTDNMGWPAIFCRGSQKPVSNQDDASLIRQCDIENHIVSGGKWIIISGHVYDIEGYHCEIAHVNELLSKGCGKDLTSDLCNPLYRIPFEHITSNLKVGKFVLNDNDDRACGFQNISLTHLNTERALAYLLGLRACILQRGPILQPAEIQCKNLLNSPIFSGGLQVLQPSNPFDEEKGEARSSASTGSTPTEASSIFASELPQPALWPHMLITHRVDSLLTGLSEARLTDPLVSTWYTIADRFCKENSFIWHQDFPPEHPISELERHLTAVFIRHQSLGPLVLAVVDRELSGASDKLPKPVADVIRLVHQTKFTLIKTRQQLNRSYKEVCAPMLEKCRFLLYEVRPAISIEQLALKRLNILRKPTRFKSLVRRIISDIRTAKVLHDIAKPDDILNVTIQSQTGAVKQHSNENLKNINSNDNLLSNKTSSTDNINDVDPKKVSNEHVISTNDSNVTSDKKIQIESDAKTPNNLENCRRNKKANEWDDLNDQFVNDFIAKLSEKSMQICDNIESLSSVMTLIVDFILQENCDVETLRRAMFCEVQRYQIRKLGLEMFAELLNVKGLLDEVAYNVLSGYLGLFLDKSKQHYLGNILDDLNMITAFQKADLLLCHKTIIEWAIFELQKFVNQEQIFGKQKSHAGKDSSNLGTYVFLKKLPRARFLLSVFGIFVKRFGRQ